MNIQDYVGLLYKWFQSNNSFQLDRDFKKIILISENESEDRAGFKCAADLLSQEKYCYKSNDLKENLDYYFIYSSLPNQNVSISPKICTEVSELLNKYLPLAGVSHRSNPIDIKEIDVLYLLKLIYLYEVEKTNQTIEKIDSESSEEND